MLSNSHVFRTSFSYSLICFQGLHKGPIHHCVKGQTMKHSLPNILLEDTVLWGSYSTEIMKNRHPTIHVTLKRGTLILSIWKMILAYSRVERAKIHFLEGIYQLMLRMDTSPRPSHSWGPTISFSISWVRPLPQLRVFRWHQAWKELDYTKKTHVQICGTREIGRNFLFPIYFTQSRNQWNSIYL